ncbi:hypothetical protein TRVA0_011S00870 [Trichomonascus vanleenenianus]|uniref:cysteine--tRNA ligase n=1 Tax=Trichomonascus vanleenenianus TaxID=2268995 RepID=UPI003EC9EAE0
MEAKITQPPWHKPAPQEAAPVLKVFNTLNREKSEVIPLEPGRLSWYSCGPTVYDAAHMGHARNYVTIDINRRILQDYFGYDIMFVQNVTDIDDKIIIRARQGYLFEQFRKQVGDKVDDKLVARLEEALKLYNAEHVNGPDEIEGLDAWIAVLPEETREGAKFKMHMAAIRAAHKAIGHKATISVDEFLALGKPVLLYALDKQEGHTGTDHKIFRDLSSHWENDFNRDMAKLNVQQASVTTRVSEYVPEIVDFIEGIVKNGFGYESGGSVYFDTAAFEKGGHDYAKLQPWHKGRNDLIAEGEGALVGSTREKKSSNDFALWKASKPGEPSWDSPWGKGRPGWHIECSVMASAILGKQMDIHSGGIDLAFPHHDNELAQSEAFHNNDQWVNYFMHTGHLHIEGSKMSKSLKNFISIKDALKTYSPRQLRLAFAMQQWNNQFDFKPQLSEVKAFEATLSNFFNNIKARLEEENHKLAEGAIIPRKPGAEELALYDALHKARKEVHAAFCNNLSTPAALGQIGELVQAANAYIVAKDESAMMEPLVEIGRWITKILRILGFETASEIGWKSSSSVEGGSTEDIARPFVKQLSQFRDDVRTNAIDGKDSKEFLNLTDKLRDVLLQQFGVLLDDRGKGQPALVKFLDADEKEARLKEKALLEAKEKERLAKKAENARKAEEERQKKIEKAKVPPQDLFKGNPLYTEWDDNGIPTKDKEGQEVTKSMRKKLEKEHKAQQQLHQKFLDNKL